MHKVNNAYFYRMINKDRNKPYNELPLLPLPSDRCIDEEVLRLLADARGRIGELKGLARLIPNQGMLVNSVSLQEAKASSEIENIYTTQDELFASFSSTEETKGTAKEVLNYREAIWKGYESIRNGSPLGEQNFIDLYQTIKEANDGYRDPLRKTVIKKGGSTITSGQVIYTPPRGEGIIEIKMKNLVEYLNENPEDPLLKMCLSHFQFEAIHPFSDGNGRTGRIINVLYLTQQGYLQLPILFLSKYILENRTDYYHELGGVTQRGFAKGWIKYMLKAVASTATSTINLIEALVQAEEYVNEKIKRDNKKLYSPELVKIIFTQPFTTVKQMYNAGIGTEKTCRKYLGLLSSDPLSIMDKLTISGKVYYANKELISSIGP